MCRGLYDTHPRRCPSSSPERRAAYRKALKERKASESAGIGGAGWNASPVSRISWEDRREDIAHLTDLSRRWLDSSDLAAIEALQMRFGIDSPDLACEKAVNAVGQHIAEEALARIGGLPTLPQRFNPTANDVKVTTEGSRFLVELGQKYGAIVRERHEKSVACSTRLAQAYKEILSEIRPMGGRLETAGRPTGDVKTSILEAQECFPTSWIEASNTDSSNLPRVRKTQKRGHYVHVKASSVDGHERTGVHAHRVVPGWNGMSRDERAEAVAEHPGFIQWGRNSTMLYYRPEYDREADKMTALGYMVSTAYDSPGPEWTQIPHPGAPERRIWITPRITRNPTGPNEPEILTSPTGGPTVEGQNRLTSVTIHEFTHRFERVVPAVARLERIFYDRRTAGEQPRWLGSGYRSNEMTRADKFIRAYMGKEYPKQRYGEAFELMSTGMEALFAGKYGGLWGGSQSPSTDNARDDDMRNFVLGVLATA